MEREGESRESKTQNRTNWDQIDYKNGDSQRVKGVMRRRLSVDYGKGLVCFSIYGSTTSLQVENFWRVNLSFDGFGFYRKVKKKKKGNKILLCDNIHYNHDWISTCDY